MWSTHFIINFEISLVNFLNVLGFLLLTSEKDGGDTFLICYFFSDYCFLLFRWSWCRVTALGIFYDLFKCLRFLKGCLKAILRVPISLTRKLRKTTHTHTHTHTHTRLFFFEKSWEKFFLKPLVFEIQFWNKSWILFLRIVPIWRNSWNFTLKKRILQKCISSYISL